MSSDYYGDYDLGAEGSVPFSVNADGQFSASPSPIQTFVSPLRASIPAFRADPPDKDLQAALHYKVDDLVGHHNNLPDDFVPSEDTSTRHSSLPADFDPHTMWNFYKK